MNIVNSFLEAMMITETAPTCDECVGEYINAGGCDAPEIPAISFQEVPKPYSIELDKVSVCMVSFAMLIYFIYWTLSRMDCIRAHFFYRLLSAPFNYAFVFANLIVVYPLAFAYTLSLEFYNFVYGYVFPYNFEGLSVLITGASGGLGGALAQEFSNLGVKQIFLVARNVKKLNLVKESLQKLNSEVDVQIVPFDLGVEGAATKLLEAVEKIQPDLDILVNNAGVVLTANVLDTSIEHQKLSMMVNAHTPCQLSALFAKHMKTKRKNKYILNISSVAGDAYFVNWAFYCAAKAFLDHFTHILELETSGTNVKIGLVKAGHLEGGLGGFDLGKYAITHEMDSSAFWIVERFRTRQKYIVIKEFYWCCQVLGAFLPTYLSQIIVRLAGKDPLVLM